MIENATKLPRLLRLTALILVLAALAGYAYFKSYNLIAGPEISVSAPENGKTLEQALIEVRGTAERISHITLNDRQIFINESGAFSEQLLLSYGYNILTLEARDRFGRTTEETIELVYK